MLGQSVGVCPAVIRCDRRPPLDRGGVGRPHRAGGRPAPGRRCLRLWPTGDPAQRAPARHSRPPQRRRRPYITRCARDRSRPRALRLSVGSRNGPRGQGTALRDRLPAPRPDGVRGRALRSLALERGHDAGRADAAHGSRDDAPAAERGPVAAHQLANRGARPRRASWVAAQLRHQRAAAGGIGSQPAFW